MVAHHPLLARHGARPTQDLPLLAHLPEAHLARARVHEACGGARHTLALWLAAQTSGPVLWVAPDWTAAHLNSDGISDWIDPGRLVFVHPRRAQDVLWTMEEALHAGACPLVVGDLPALPSLTQVRRMHLAAENGAQNGPHTPTGLLLTPGDGGAAGVETRWHLAPAHADDATQWRLERRRARTAPVRGWNIQAQKADHGLRLKSA